MADFIWNIDRDILLFIQDFIRNGVLTPFFKLITTLGNGGIIWLVFSVILLCFKRTRKAGGMCLVALIGVLVIDQKFIKELVQRERPFTTIDNLMVLITKPTDFSFPSGHTASACACAWISCRKLPKKISIPVVILAVLIAFSRLYVGVHYPSDVLAGAVTGVLIAFAVEKIFKLIGKRIQKNKGKTSQE